MSFVKSGAVALALSVAALAPQFAMAQAIAVPTASLDSIIAACSQNDAALCSAAIQTAMNGLTAANPNATVESLLGALMSEVASAGNAAVLAGNTAVATAMAAAAESLAVAAETAGVSQTIITTYHNVATSFSSNTAVDLTEVNQVTGTDGTAPDVPASPI